MDSLRSQHRLRHTIVFLLLLFGLSSLPAVQATVLQLNGGTAYLDSTNTTVWISGTVNLYPRPNTQYGTLDIILQDTNARIAHLSAAIARHAQFTLPHSDQYTYRFNVNTGRVEIRHAGNLMLSLPVNRQGETPRIKVGENSSDTRIQVDQNGQIVANTLPVVETTQPPPAPGNLVAVAADQSIELSWNAVSNATAYVLYYGTDSNIHPDVNNSFTQRVVLGNVTQHRVSGLNNGTTYYVVLTSQRNTVESSPSAVVSGTPHAATAQLIAGRYLPIEDGSIIRDITTNLEWQRCAVGQTWNATQRSCDGDTSGFGWGSAVALTAPGGFRLPDITELRSLVYCSTGLPQEFGMDADYTMCSGDYQRPTIVEQAFPNTPSLGFWSSSPDAGNSLHAWLVSFNSGRVSGSSKSFASRVRLVRAPQPTVDDDLIAGRYLPIEDGSIIRDITTDLEWQRCAVGQTWNAVLQSCDGDASTFNWDNAVTLTAPGGFRLPDITELRGLVYCSTGQPHEFGTDANFSACSGDYQRPTIVEQAFPNTPSSWFWSSSPHAYSSVHAWGVDFHYGRVLNGYKSNTLRVRLVRAPDSSPDDDLIAGRYLPIEDGSIIRDITTDLEWQRCAVGQTWNATQQSCDGEADWVRYPLDNAMQLTDSRGFRLPDITELRSLVYCSTGQPQEFGMDANFTRCSGDFQRPTIVQHAFPNMPIPYVYFWSSSYSGGSGMDTSAWQVDFDNGSIFGSFQDNASRVRLVRNPNEVEHPLPELRLEAGDSQITASWNETSGYVYNLFISSDANCDISNYSRCANGQMFSNVSSGYTLRGLDNSREYYVVLQVEGQGIDSPILTGAVAATPQAIETEPPSVVINSAIPLNDTGIDWCADNSSNNLSCPVAGFPDQDGDHGRDALARQGQLQKIGAGAAGFDYTKLDANGRPLAIQNMPWSDGGNETDGTRWSCVQDNVTGLIWEVKVNESTLRYHGHTYSWYNPDPNTNGGDAGTQNGGRCVGSACDTLGYVQAVNAQGLCGANDWRLPDINELESLVHAGRFDPAIDIHYFPEGSSSVFWSSTSTSIINMYAWGVRFYDGLVNDYEKVAEQRARIRLVRVIR
ncbi:DUF1566 domain-containing protein [Thiorhodospira sibirica]|uniref:Lcl domain-containing protein n=1 Tax=Thiorhodospira sibirica TaxID=154347 RepID=UPI00022C04A5|nr:DUF1566 domain-containing protein [Thiorhodospira sibirica]